MGDLGHCYKISDFNVYLKHEVQIKILPQSGQIFKRFLSPKISVYRTVDAVTPHLLAVFLVIVSWNTRKELIALGECNAVHQLLISVN